MTCERQTVQRHWFVSFSKVNTQVLHNKLVYFLLQQFSNLQKYPLKIFLDINLIIFKFLSIIFSLLLLAYF